MAGSTPVYGLPYPELVDPPDGPAAVKALAEATEPELERIDTAHADVVAELDGMALVSADVVEDSNVSGIGAQSTVSRRSGIGVLTLELSPNIQWPAASWSLILPVAPEFRPVRRYYFAAVSATGSTYALVFNPDGTVQAGELIPAGAQLLGTVSYPLALS